MSASNVNTALSSQGRYFNLISTSLLTVYLCAAITFPYARMFEKFIVVSLFCLIRSFQELTDPDQFKGSLPSREFIFLFLVCLIAGVFWISYGWPSAASNSLVYIGSLYVGYPICALVLITLGQRNLSERGIDRVLLGCLACIAIHFLILLLVWAHVFPDLEFLRDPLLTGKDSFQSFLTVTCVDGMKVYSNAISSLVFLVPFAVIRSLQAPLLTSAWWLRLSCAIGGIFALISSGRFGAMIGAALAIAASVVFLVQRAPDLRRSVLLSVAALITFSLVFSFGVVRPLSSMQCPSNLGHLSTNGSIDQQASDAEDKSAREKKASNAVSTVGTNSAAEQPLVPEGSGLSADRPVSGVIEPSNPGPRPISVLPKAFESILEVVGRFDRSGIRIPQARELLTGFLQRPLLGHGAGTVAGMIRDPAHPWRYELSYFSMLFHNGLVGFMIYAAGVVWIFIRGGAFSYKKPQAIFLPLIAGLTSILVAYATNPYLDAFDILWTLFLPAACVDLAHRSRKPASAS